MNVKWKGAVYDWKQRFQPLSCCCSIMVSMNECWMNVKWSGTIFYTSIWLKVLLPTTTRHCSPIMWESLKYRTVTFEVQSAYIYYDLFHVVPATKNYTLPRLDNTRRNVRVKGLGLGYPASFFRNNEADIRSHEIILWSIFSCTALYSDTTNIEGPEWIAIYSLWNKTQYLWNVKRPTDFSLKNSKMTFSHQLIRWTTKRSKNNETLHGI